MDRIFISNCTAGDVGRARDSTSIAISKQISEYIPSSSQSTATSHALNVHQKDAIIKRITVKYCGSY